MLKFLILAGIVAGCCAIGWMGVARVMSRKKAMQAFLRDMQRTENLLAQQNITLPNALRRIAEGNPAGVAYCAIAKQMQTGAAGAQQKAILRQLMQEPAFCELKSAELLRMAEYLSGLTDCISAEEISQHSAWFAGEWDEMLRNLEENDCKRAKLLRTIWLLAGLCAAVILA